MYIAINIYRKEQFEDTKEVMRSRTYIGGQTMQMSKERGQQDKQCNDLQNTTQKQKIEQHQPL